MVTTPAQIDLWLRGASEHQRLEFKEAKNQFDSAKLNRYCVALANEGGGTLILGVTDKPPRRIVGTQAFLDPVGTAEKLSAPSAFAWTSKRSRTPMAGCWFSMSPAGHAVQPITSTVRTACGPASSSCQ
jgi:hypothetical protein